MVSPNFWSPILDSVCFFIGDLIVFNQRIEPAIGKTFYTILVIFVSLVLPILLLSFPFLKLEKHYPSQSLETIPRDIVAIINIKLLKYYKILKTILLLSVMILQIIFLLKGY